MIVKCKKCGHEWNYNGKSKYYATCSMCMLKTKIIGKSTEA